MSTINLTDTDLNSPVQIAAGQYLFAGVDFGSTLDLFVNIGDAKNTPITDAQLTADDAKVVWLPNCTVYVTADTPGPAFGSALAKLSTTLEDV